MRRIRIEATAYPGLIDLIRGDDGSAPAEVSGGLMAYLETPYVAGSAIESEIRTAVLEGSGVEPVQLSAEHVYWLKSFLHPSRETIVGQQTSPIPVQTFLLAGLLPAS